MYETIKASSREDAEKLSQYQPGELVRITRVNTFANSDGTFTVGVAGVETLSEKEVAALATEMYDAAAVS